MKKTMCLAEYLGRLFIFACLALGLSQGPLWAADSADSSAQKVLLVLVFDQNCKAWCAKVRPIVAELQKSYGEQAEFSEIDVTQTSMEQAKKKAEELRIHHYIQDVTDLVPLVMIFSGNRRKFREIVGPKERETYENELKKFLSK